MTEKRIAMIFRSTCIAQGRIVDPVMGARWRTVLGRFTREEVLAAIAAWRGAVEPPQGTLLGKRKTGLMPTAEDLRARILAVRESAYQAGEDVARRNREIEEFWRVVDERGVSDEEIAERWPSYVGTRPAKREDTA
jgi:hypothetical protein